MTARHLICALAATVALAAPAQAAEPEVRTADVACRYDDASFNWSEAAWHGIQCWQDRSWWVNGSGVRLVRLFSDGDGQHGLTIQMTGQNLHPYADIDWDPAHMSGSVCCWVPASYGVTIRP